ncbi:MAG: hypothetical protein GQ564_01895 [Bacteroidales bacterium]|nr:hypothetical protein [Bacteroidales bacterium]
MNKRKSFLYSQKFCLFIVLLLVSCRSNSKDVFDYSQLSSNDREIIINQIDSLKRSNKFYKIIFKELDRLEKPIVFFIKNDVEIAGFVPNKATKGGNIIFTDINKIYNEHVIVEEIFHAFQYSFYGKNSMIKNDKGEVVGGPNYEYEAKLMRAIVNLSQNKPAAETPSQKGLLDFTLSLINENGNITSFEFTENQHKLYINLVKHFQIHWKQRNINEERNSLYDDPIIENLGPKACLHILKIYYL